MKNLMPGSLSIMRRDKTRVTLPACEHPPVIEPGTIEVARRHGDLEIIYEPFWQVTFPNWEDDPRGGPYVVTQEVFDLLPADAIEFVTPDLDSCIKNGLGIPHVILKFIAKPAASVVIKKQKSS